MANLFVDFPQYFNSIFLISLFMGRPQTLALSIQDCHGFFSRPTGSPNPLYNLCRKPVAPGFKPGPSHTQNLPPLQMRSFLALRAHICRKPVAPDSTYEPSATWGRKNQTATTLRKSLLFACRNLLVQIWD